MARSARSEGDAARSREERASEELPTSAPAPRAELDALLDEIDEVLEEDAEAFVRGYVQKGGQ